MNIRTKDGKRIVRLTQTERKAMRAFESILSDLQLVTEIGYANAVAELVEQFDRDEVVL